MRSTCRPGGARNDASRRAGSWIDEDAGASRPSHEGSEKAGFVGRNPTERPATPQARTRGAPSPRTRVIDYSSAAAGRAAQLTAAGELAGPAAAWHREESAWAAEATTLLCWTPWPPRRRQQSRWWSDGACPLCEDPNRRSGWKRSSPGRVTTGPLSRRACFAEPSSSRKSCERATGVCARKGGFSRS